MHRTRIFLRYMVMYLCIVALLLGLIIPLYATNLRTSKRIMVENVRSQLERGVSSLEALVVRTNTLVWQLKNNESLSLLQLKRAPFSAKDHYYAHAFNNFFSSLFSTEEDMSSMVLYLPNGFLFSDKRYFTKADDFYNYYLAYEGWNQQQWEEQARSAFSFWPMRRVVFREHPDGKCITYNCNLGTNTSPASLSLLLSEQSLLEKLLPAGETGRLGLRILPVEAGGALLDETAHLLDEKGRLPDCEKISCYSDLLNMDFEVLIPQSVYRQQMQGVEMLPAFGGALILLLSVGFSLLFAARSARPIANLIEGLEKEGFSPEEKAPDPLAYTSSLISQLNISRKHLEKETQELKSTLEALKFEQLLLGGAQESRGFEIRTPHLLAILRLEGEGEKEERLLASVFSIAQNILGGEQGMHLSPDKNLILLLPCEPENLEPLRLQLQQVLDVLSPLPVVIALSNPFTGAQRMQAAFTEAQFALGRRTAELIRFYRDIDVQENNILLSLSYYTRLDACLGGDSVRGVELFFEDLREKLAAGPQTTYELRQILQLLHTVLAGRMGFENGHRLQPPDSLSRGACEAHLTRIEGLCRQVVEGNITAQKSHNRRLRQDILDFIAGHFDDPNLSLTYVAERFHISPRYLSAFIKEQTGQNYSDYLEQLRLKRACELLRGSQSIQEIAAGVGFTSSNTFYKCFKRRYGMSPSSYRTGAAEKPEG